MAFGLPVVSTTWRGIPQLVGDSGAAILCDINAPDQYASAIGEVLKHSEKRQRMGEAALKHYENHYTRDKFVAAMEEVFQTVLKSRSLEVGKSGS
jgi:glycosyltransferase involved in cell wall biosynthesis